MYKELSRSPQKYFTWKLLLYEGLNIVNMFVALYSEMGDWCCLSSELTSDLLLYNFV